MNEMNQSIKTDLYS